MFLFFQGLSGNTYSQITAGSVPTGTGISYPNINLSVAGSIAFIDTNAFLDLDCDGIDDIRIRLSYGAPQVDSPNEVELYKLTNTFSFCLNVLPVWNPALYSYGDTLCSGSSQWITSPKYKIGCAGGFSCYPFQPTVVDKYLAYNKFATQQTGWIKISYNLYAYPTTLSISELLVLCNTTSISSVNSDDHFILSPNPTLDGEIKINWDKQISTINIYNSHGQKIKSISGNIKEFSLPEQSGLYFMSVLDADGNCRKDKIIRL